MTSKEINLKGTWSQAIIGVAWPVLVILLIRWAFVEPFVIPSGSMIPNLLIHDHILVSKLSYGWHWPFSKSWMVRWADPKRGDIVVFRYPENPEVFYIKRLIGLPGDKIETIDGKIRVNGTDLALLKIESQSDHEKGFVYFTESGLSDSGHIVRFMDYESRLGDHSEFQVPQGQYFFMGDNRDQSSDSRVWGFVPEALIVGQAKWIWLSCEKTLESTPSICDPGQIRWGRVLRPL